MKIEETILNNLNIEYPLESLAPVENILFLDIETTGFLSGSSSIYMIGTAFFDGENWCVKQFFASDNDEEATLLETFLDFAKNYKFLVHFNGNTFDLPFINAKAQKYGITNTIANLRGIDIYKRIAPYKSLLKLPDCKQKTIEKFMGINREDEFSGGELIQVYQEYLSTHSYELYQTLLLHNSDDMKGMLEVVSVLSYSELFNKPLKATRVSANYYKDMNGLDRSELVIEISLPGVLPRPVSFMGQGCHFKGESQTGTLIVPIYEEELKYFYANYKDYYYLPLEDIALHKSIASYVDKEFREDAKKENCYTRKMGSFLPQWAVLVSPFYKRDYLSEDLFFELTDEVKKNRELFNQYASHVLNKIAFQK